MVRVRDRLSLVLRCLTPPPLSRPKGPFYSETHRFTLRAILRRFRSRVLRMISTAPPNSPGSQERVMGAKEVVDEGSTVGKSDLAAVSKKEVENLEISKGDEILEVEGTQQEEENAYTRDNEVGGETNWALVSPTKVGRSPVRTPSQSEDLHISASKFAVLSVEEEQEEGEISEKGQVLPVIRSVRRKRQVQSVNRVL
ncbi:hypothetical protein DY000_02016575 [Brassica cretica]|uniref:Uncharacterized protein n=1 Tax=Brassica cretica TaxID=69181 RepID=A0ABQ7CT05_BRACR|nr:hypothetical protein DY000_02016575 [Brassica cretica]